MANCGVTTTSATTATNEELVLDRAFLDLQKMQINHLQLNSSKISIHNTCANKGNSVSEATSMNTNYLLHFLLRVKVSLAQIALVLVVQCGDVVLLPLSARADLSKRDTRPSDY